MKNLWSAVDKTKRIRKQAADWEKLFAKDTYDRGAWVAQLVKRPTLAQVMISQFVGWSPASDSADSSELGVYFRVCVSLSLCPSPACPLSLKNK